MLQQMNIKEAMRHFAEGRRVLVLEQNEDGTVDGYDIAHYLNEDMILLVDVPIYKVDAPDQSENEAPETENEEPEELPFVTVPNPVPEEPKEEPKKKSKANKTSFKPKYDRGKIMALYNAGWTYKEIADEMNAPYMSIYKIVKEKLNNG